MIINVFVKQLKNLVNNKTIFLYIKKLKNLLYE